ncbi:MAG: hypothetical protein TUN42_04160 [Dehalogenimonas sp.]
MEELKLKVKVLEREALILEIERDAWREMAERLLVCLELLEEPITDGDGDE